MPATWQTVRQLLNQEGHRGSIVSIERLGELKDEIETRRREKELDEELDREYLSGFLFQPPEDFPQTRSIIVVATRDPLARFPLLWKGQELAGLVPPTYLHGRRINGRIEALLGEHLRASGHRVASARLPRKLLAVRSGLARYGRNNITYVEGMGSFHRLAAFFSSLPYESDDWRLPEMLERCRVCSACRRACPTGAIGEDRFLLYAERCLVFHNEKPARVPFPQWIQPDWHHCLVGCMICQQACPENREMLDFICEETAFSEDEIRLLLDGVGLDDLPAETAGKLRSADLVDLLDVLPRNLRALLDAEGQEDS